MAHDKGIIFQKTIFSLVFLSLFFATTMLWGRILYKVALKSNNLQYITLVHWANRPMGQTTCPRWPGHLTMAHDKGIIFQKTIFSLVFLSLFFATTMIWAWILYEVALHVVIGKIESWFESEMLVISTAKHKLESIKEIYAVRLQYSFVYEITKVRWNEKFSPKLSKKESSKVECNFIKDLSPLCTLPTLEHLLHWYP